MALWWALTFWEALKGTPLATEDKEGLSLLILDLLREVLPTFHMSVVGLPQVGSPSASFPCCAPGKKKLLAAASAPNTAEEAPDPYCPSWTRSPTRGEWSRVLNEGQTPGVALLPFFLAPRALLPAEPFGVRRHICPG